MQTLGRDQYQYPVSASADTTDAGTDTITNMDMRTRDCCAINQKCCVHRQIKRLRTASCSHACRSSLPAQYQVTQITHTADAWLCSSSDAAVREEWFSPLFSSPSRQCRPPHVHKL